MFDFFPASFVLLEHRLCRSAEKGSPFKTEVDQGRSSSQDRAWKDKYSRGRSWEGDPLAQWGSSITWAPVKRAAAQTLESESAVYQAPKVILMHRIV